MPKNSQNNSSMSKKTAAKFEEFWEEEFGDIPGQKYTKSIARICWINATFYAIEECSNLVKEQINNERTDHE